MIWRIKLLGFTIMVTKELQCVRKKTNMSKAMYRVYCKEDKKYLLLASFVFEEDANFYVRNKLNDCPPELETRIFKIMQGNRNIKVFI